MQITNLILLSAAVSSFTNSFQINQKAHHLQASRKKSCKRLLLSQDPPSEADGDKGTEGIYSVDLNGISQLLYQSIVETSAKYFDVSPHQFNTLVLRQHKPLGCTAEESLNSEEDGTKHVFVSKVVEDGNAERNGILVGDVIVGVSGPFKDVVNTVESDLDRMLVSAFVCFSLFLLNCNAKDDFVAFAIFVFVDFTLFDFLHTKDGPL